MSKPDRSLIQKAQDQNGAKPPVWLMRQAGRYLPEYNEVRREAGDFVDLCLNPELACEVTLQPIRRFGFDAAIIFSDILMIPYALGQKLWFETKGGPCLGDPTWGHFDPKKLEPVYEAIHLTRQRLGSETALIGFAGAPWTLLLYSLQGKGGNEFHDGRLKVYADLDDARTRMKILTKAVSDHLIAQIDAGCDTIQIFDSWAALCPMVLQKEFIIDPAAEIVARIRRKRPEAGIIAFPKGFADQNVYQNTVKPDAMGMDQFTSLNELKSRKVVAQGNLDPLALMSGGKVLDEAVDQILLAMNGKAHIFNLGHGIHKETPPDHVTQLVKRIRA